MLSHKVVKVVLNESSILAFEELISLGYQIVQDVEEKSNVFFLVPEDSDDWALDFDNHLEPDSWDVIETRSIPSTVLQSKDKPPYPWETNDSVYVSPQGIPCLLLYQEMGSTFLLHPLKMILKVSSHEFLNFWKCA